MCFGGVLVECVGADLHGRSLGTRIRSRNTKGQRIAKTFYENEL